MKMSDSQVYSVSRHAYKLPGDLRVNVTVTDDPYDLSPATLFSMAARRNEKRSFLFVSKVLGKHIPLSPYVPLLASGLLAARYMSVTQGVEAEFTAGIVSALKNNVGLEEAYAQLSEAPFETCESLLFIGFAETATALGHAMFDCFKGDHHYVHTTREVIPGMKASLEFSEEHSHAVAHYVYAQSEGLKKDCPVVLIDDEMTSGKTSLNIIRSIQGRYPRKKYTVVSILDWRSVADEKAFEALEEELGITIETVCLMRGIMQAEGKAILENIPPLQVAFAEPALHRVSLGLHVAGEMQGEQDYLAYTGRFGISSNDKSSIDEYARKCAATLASKLDTGETLCLGTGELMYLPMRIASRLGENILYQSTTRSPVYPSTGDDYAVKTASSYESPEHPGVINYLYNISPGSYDNICVFFERPVEDEKLQPMLEALKRTGSRNIYLVTLAR